MHVPLPPEIQALSTLSTLTPNCVNSWRVEMEKRGKTDGDPSGSGAAAADAAQSQSGMGGGAVGTNPVTGTGAAPPSGAAASATPTAAAADPASPAIKKDQSVTDHGAAGGGVAGCKRCAGGASRTQPVKSIRRDFLALTVLRASPHLDDACDERFPVSAQAPAGTCCGQPGRPPPLATPMHGDRDTKCVCAVQVRCR